MGEGGDHYWGLNLGSLIKDQQVGRASLTKDIVEVGDGQANGTTSAASWSYRSGRANDGIKVRFLGSLILYLGGLISAVTIVVPEPTSDRGGITIDGILNKVILYNKYDVLKR